VYRVLIVEQYVRPRGTVVCIGMPADAYLRAPVFGTVIKMVSIKGSYVGNRRDSAEAIEFFRRGGISCPIKVRVIRAELFMSLTVFEVVPLSKLNDVYELMEKAQITGRYVLDCSA
jgi:alcohol dehydrogenase, propanol-preferring